MSIHNKQETIDSLNIAGTTASTSSTTGALVCSGGVGVAGNLNISGSKGVIPTGQTYGIYDAAYEIDFTGTTITQTDNGLVKTVATLPANCRIIDAYMLTTIAMNNDNEKGLDLVVTSTSPTAANVVIDDNVEQVITGAEYRTNNNGVGVANAFVSAVWHNENATGTSIGSSGTGTHLCLINTDDQNTAHTITSGKIVVYIKYMGSAAPVANTTV